MLLKLLWFEMYIETN